MILIRICCRIMDPDVDLRTGLFFHKFIPLPVPVELFSYHMVFYALFICIYN